MASTLLDYRVFYHLLPDNQFSFKLLVDITTRHTIRPMMFDFSKDEMMLVEEDDDSPSKQRLVNFFKDSRISPENIESLLSELFRKSVNAIESAGEGFKGIVFLVMEIRVSVPEESDEAIEATIQELLFETRFKPAAKSSVRALKTVKFEKQKAAGTSSCVICLKDFIDGLELTKLPCGHDFHGDCIVEWLNTSHYCPLCRFSLPCEEESG